MVNWGEESDLALILECFWNAFGIGLHAWRCWDVIQARQAKYLYSLGHTQDKKTDTLDPMRYFSIPPLSPYPFLNRCEVTGQELQVDINTSLETSFKHRGKTCHRRILHGRGCGITYRVLPVAVCFPSWPSLRVADLRFTIRWRTERW
jgi:hypothetical protein